MSVTFGDLWNELTASVRILDPIASQKFCNRAWQDIGKAYEWSWLRASGVFSAPAVITTGTVAVTQFSRSLVFDAAATTVLDAITADIPLTTRQIKIAGGPPYNIASYTLGGTATLDPLGPAYQEATSAAAAYSIVKAYYAPPSADFARLISARDPVSGYQLRFGSLWTQQTLDRLDPLRSAASYPLVIATLNTVRTDAGIAAGSSATGEITAYSPRYEIWPHPTVARGFQLDYRKRTVPFVGDDDTIPDSLGDELVLWRAKCHAYEWAETNKANQPDLQATNWGNMIGLARLEYANQLRVQIKHDKELFPNSRVFMQQGLWRNDPTSIQQYGDIPAHYAAMLGTFS